LAQRIASLGTCLGRLALVVGLPGGGWRVCTIAVRHKAGLSLPSPACDRGGGTTRPLEASGTRYRCGRRSGQDDRVTVLPKGGGYGEMA